MTEAEKRTHRVCFTGHRPEKLTRSDGTILRDEHMSVEIIYEKKQTKMLVRIGLSQ